MISLLSLALLAVIVYGEPLGLDQTYQGHVIISISQPNQLLRVDLFELKPRG